MTADPVPGDHEFALCLTHDVDRPFKGYRALYYALSERPRYHLRTLTSDANPYWQFGRIVDLERSLGVRSAFYFLDEPHLLDRPVREWVDPRTWVQFLGRYDLTDPAFETLLAELDEGGWEVGLHGSIPAHEDRERLRAEKERVESVLGDTVAGGRQHYLRLDGRRTWENQSRAGLDYDASLGSGTAYGFAHGYEPFRPFDDEFAVFPLTLMEQALPDPETRFDRAWEECRRLLREASANDAVMTALWHPRYFSESEFPGYARLYERLVERALDMGAWVGPPGHLYEQLDSGAALRKSGEC
jgi:peptidoglycan/xylan/chitin deacetylase (PgdA/CDA1 family)